MTNGGMVPNRAKARKKYTGNTVSIAALNGTGSLPYTVPDGYTELDEIQFDPDKDVIFNLRSQKIGGDVMSDVSTKIGAAQGSIFPGLEAIPNDNLKVNFRVVAAAAFPAQVSFTLVFK